MAALPNRKQKHLDICLNRNMSIDTGDNGLSSIRLPHKSLPVSNTRDISLSTHFLGFELNSPLMISCMTGGSSKGKDLNRILARAAGRNKIAVGTGSIRVMLAHPETRSHFELKSLASEVPVLANIGGAQLNEDSIGSIIEAVKSIEADGLYVHLNPAQEFFQEGGDRLFSSWYEGIARLVEKADFPVLVKETGAGIPPSEGLKLLDIGVSYIDIAGSGGTDWVKVEALSRGFHGNSAAEAFQGWGYSTGELLLAYRQITRAGGSSGSQVSDRIIASGGLRNPLDFALSLACGAWIAAAALPFIRLASEDGMEAVSRYIEELETGIRAAIVLSGSGSLEELRKSNLRIKPDIMDNAEKLAEEALKAACS